MISGRHSGQLLRRVGETTFNTVAVIDADGTIVGQYRKTHSDDHFYQEKFYLRPEIPASRSGIRLMRKSASVSAGTSGSGSACRRCRAPSCCSTRRLSAEPILDCDSMPHWRRCMQGHAAANIMPLIAANRIGTETVKPTEDNQHQSSSLTFYGSSFIADETGALVEQADRENAGVLTHTFDLDEIREMRRSWGVYRDRRPEMYGAMRGYGL
ncbi:MAG: nitrilase-related carbon-nitrogen hydrolase [Butyricicoccus sp.]